jgi:chromosome segregation ATPase
MSVYEENRELIVAMTTTVLGIIATWFSKDKISEAWNTKVGGKIAEKKADSEIKIAEKDSAITAFEKAIETLTELVNLKKEEAHECNQKLKDMADRMSSLEATVELYRKRVIDLEAKYGQA